MKLENVKRDCRFFKGEIPCQPHKKEGVHCVEADGSVCKYYSPFDKRILIIKLGAIGDVIRTTPLFTRLKAEYPHAKFYWLTNTPEVVPQEVDEILKFDFKSVLYLQQIKFDILINLDKDKEACALADSLSAFRKFGFILRDGVPYPADEKAEHKILTGIFDDLNKENKKNYLEEIFEIVGFQYEGEKYVLSSFEEFGQEWEIDKSKKVVGLNTGCGGRWTSRLWPEKYWNELARKLLDAGYEVILLGGEDEHEKNLKLAETSGAKYFGHFPLRTFINLVNQCDLVVTTVTMAMHITLALGKKIVLMNNIFNPNEFELFGLGEIVQPEKECRCFFSPKCTNPEYRCMDYLFPQTIFELVRKLLK